MAADLLDAFGYEQSSSGLWRRSETADAEMIRGLVEEAELAYETITNRFVPAFRERAVKYIEDGKRPPPPEVLSLPGDWFAMDEDERAEWGRRRAAEYEDEYGGDADDDEPPDQPLLDLEYIDLRCSCGAPSCKGHLTFETVGDRRVRMSFRNVDDHFVLAPSFFVLLDENLGDDE